MDDGYGREQPLLEAPGRSTRRDVTHKLPNFPNFAMPWGRGEVVGAFGRYHVVIYETPSLVNRASPL